MIENCGSITVFRFNKGQYVREFSSSITPRRCSLCHLSGPTVHQVAEKSRCVSVCVCPAVYSILFSHQCVMSCEHIRLPAKLQPSAAQCPAGRGQDSEGITKKEWRAGFGEEMSVTPRLQCEITRKHLMFMCHNPKRH